MIFLAGDMGGTKTDLALFKVEGGKISVVALERFHSAHHAAFAPPVRAFLSGRPAESAPKHACFAVAGPVIAGQARITNLPWILKETGLARDLGLESVLLINDLVATASALPALLPEDLATLQAGTPRRHGALAVIAPGTGLGQGYLTWRSTHYEAHPSEGGHADFAPHTPLEIELLKFLQRRLGHVSVERVCSGLGIQNIYAFLSSIGEGRTPDGLGHAIAEAEDPTPIIVQAGLEDLASADARRDGTDAFASADTRCSRALEMFTQILAAEAGNLALKVLSTGGLFIAGGLPPRMTGLLKAPSFLARLRDKGRFAELVSDMPVHVVTGEKIALRGAALYGLAQHDEALLAMRA